MKQSIAAWRKKANMSQTDLAEAIGVSQKAVSAWETCKANPNAENLYKMGKIFKLNPSDRILLPKDLI